MSITPENVVDPKELFLNHISEHGSVIVRTGEDAPEAEVPEAKKPAVEDPPPPIPDDEDEEEIDIDARLEALSQKIDRLAEPAAPREKHPVARTAERGGVREQLDKIRESIEADDPRSRAIVDALDTLAEKVDQQEQREADRQEQAEADRLQQWESQYEKGVVGFMDLYPGFKENEIMAIARRHRQMIERDESFKALSFEEVARRMVGGDALEARRAKQTPGAKGPSPAPSARTDAPSGSPIPARASGGGPPKKFTPGAGRGVSDITEHMRKAGIFRGVLTEK